MKLTWEPESPPDNPPEGCRDAQRWRSARGLFSAHQLEDAGSRCVCGEVWPCSIQRRAVRALVTAFLQVGPVKVAPSVQASDACRWCGREIVPFALNGWVHLHGGLVVCEFHQEGTAAVTVAEPSQ
jgi:hypothetical protein